MKFSMPADRPAQPELTVQWVKSSLSFSNGNCVEVAGLPGGQIGVRDSKDVTGPVLSFTPGNGALSWAARGMGSLTVSQASDQ